MHTDLIKHKVLEHLKSLMDDNMGKDIMPSHMSHMEVHEEPPIDFHAVGKDKHGNPMEMMGHEEQEIGLGDDMSDKDMEHEEHEPMSSMADDVMAGKEKPMHALFSSKEKKEEDPEMDNHSFIASLKKAKRKEKE